MAKRVYVFRVVFEWDDPEAFSHYGHRPWRYRYFSLAGAQRQATRLSDHGATVKGIERSLPVEWPQEALPL